MRSIPEKNVRRFREDLERFRLTRDRWNPISSETPPESLKKLDKRLSKALARAKDEVGDMVKRHREEWPDSPLFTRVSLFQPLEYGRLETAQTRALAYLFDPKAEPDHGFGDQLLRAFLEQIRCTPDGDISTAEVEAEKVIKYEKSYVRLDVDIAIPSANPRRRTIIEAKVDALGSEDQCSAIRKAVKDNADGCECSFVYLYPRSRQDEFKVEEPWIPLTWEELAIAFLRCLKNNRKAAGAAFLNLYIAGLLSDLEEYNLPVEETSLDSALLLKIVDRVGRTWR